MKQVKIQGFTEDVAPNSKPTVCVFGPENSGTTRFATTAPCEDGVIGWIAIDPNSKITLEESKKRDGIRVIVNKDPFITKAESIKVAITDDTKKSKEIYTEVLKRIFEYCTTLADHPDVESIVLDRASQIFDYVLFAHFGRKNQIESFMRGAPNQDFIDLINTMNTKNLVLVCKSSDVWGDTGAVDKDGNKKQGPLAGKVKPDGFSKIGQFTTAVLELMVSKKKLSGEDDAEKLGEKYRCKLHQCKKNPLLENMDLSVHPYNLKGTEITWDNLMQVIGV